MNKKKYLSCLGDIPQNTQCVIFGAGQGAGIFYDILQSYRPDIQVNNFIDKAKAGTYYDIPIIKPEDFMASRRNELILIASSWWSEVESYLLAHQTFHFLKVPMTFLYPSAKKRIDNRKASISANEFNYFDFFYQANEDLATIEKLKQVETILTYPEDVRLFKLITCQNQTKSKCADLLLQHYFSNPKSKQY